MTDRISSLLVTLEHDIREDDVQVLVSAIRQLRKVIDVSMNVTNSMDWVADKRAKHDLYMKIMGVLND